MDITIHTTSLPHDDPDASLAFYRDILGFEVRHDVGSGKMRWITVGPKDLALMAFTERDRGLQQAPRLPGRRCVYGRATGGGCCGRARWARWPYG
jgi:catechol 2,3-dioxygenase-like lactoylglutathione lyase family enzyme